MYETPDHLGRLQTQIKNELTDRDINPEHAGLIVKVELGFELLNLLRLQEEPIVVLWVVLSQTPIRHWSLEELDTDQRRALANARIMLPGYAGRFGWESALRDYIHYVPVEMRKYDFDVEQLEKQIIQACSTQRDFPNRIDVYQACLMQKLLIKRRKNTYAKAGECYEFDAYVQDRPPKKVTVEFDADKISTLSRPGFGDEPRLREAVTIKWQELYDVARFIDNQIGGDQWKNRFKKIIYHPVDNQQEGDTPDGIRLEDFTHLPGMVASGKSTLANLLAAWLVYNHRQNPSSVKKRITLVVGDSASSIHLANQFNRWFGLHPDRDKPVAVPLLGRTMRDKHLRQLHESREYKETVEENTVHWGERYLNPTCPLQTFISIAQLDKPLIPGKEPCGNLRKIADPTDKVVSRPTPHLCPLFAICPSQNIYRDMVDAQIWITTPGAMGAASIPAQFEPRSIRLGDLIYEQSDIVIFDEVDTVIEWFDRLYARETKLTGDGDGILDWLDPELATYQSRNRMRAAETKRWIEAERNFHAPVGHVLALIQQHEELKTSVEKGYFTSRSLFYRFSRRILGLKEYEDEHDDRKRRKNEQLVNSVMPVFDELMSKGDPLANAMPSNFHADHRITVETLRKLRKEFDGLPREDPQRATTLRKYREAVAQVAHQLVVLMQQTMNSGDSTQNPRIRLQYEGWIRQFVPDIEERLERLRLQLEGSKEDRDHQYIQRDQIDTVETLSHRLEFAVNAALLDRHIRIVFYEWHNRPTEIIDDESPYRRVPTSLLNILPLPATGRLFGIYHTPSGESNGVLSTFGYTNIGRAYVTNFHNLRASLEGQPGPNVLALSGTSYLPHSTRWHLQVKPKAVLKPAAACIEAIQDANCWFKFMPVYDRGGEPIRVSGIPDMQDAVCKMVAALVGEHKDKGGKLGDELRQLTELAEVDPSLWSDRGRLLLLVNSYDQCKAAAEEMKLRWTEMASQIYYLERSTVGDQDEEDEDQQFKTGLGRVDIELFARMNGKILIAPLQAIGRAFNILNEADKAAFGAVYFLTRPMPHPHDVPAIAQEINRRTQDWFEDPNFVAWQEGDGIYQRGIELRRQADDYWRRVESRKYYWQLHDEMDQPKSKTNDILLHANPRRDLAATTAGKIIQAIGRLLRGNVPFHAYFVDSAWAPQQARRLKGEDVPLDTIRTSLLAAIVDVLSDYVAEPVGKELYEPLFEKLQWTKNFDWKPIDQ